MRITYRPAETLDLPGILLCEIKSHDVPLDPEELRAIIDNADTHICVGEDGRICGFACLQPKEGESSTFVLERLSFKPDSYDQIIPLLETAHRLGRMHGVKRLEVSVCVLDLTHGFFGAVSTFEFVGPSSKHTVAYGVQYEHYVYARPFPPK